MEELRKLIYIKDKKGQRSIQLVNQNFRKKEISKDNQLYEGIVTGKFQTEEDASKALFESDEGGRNFRNAKIKLREKLLNHLYFLDYDKKSVTRFQKELYEQTHLMHQCQILMQEGGEDVASKLLPGLIRNAVQFEIYEVAVPAQELLREYWVQDGKISIYEEMTEELHKMRDFLNDIKRAQELVALVEVNCNKSFSSQQRILQDVDKIIKELDDKAKKHKSSRIEIMSNRLRLIKFKDLNDFKSMLEVCDFLEKKYIKKRKKLIEADISREEIADYKAHALYYTESFKDAYTYLQGRIANTKKGYEEWFTLMEYYFRMAMKAGDYELAAKIHREVKINKHFSEYDPAYVERFFVYRAFLVHFSDNKLARWGFDIEEFIHMDPTTFSQNFNYQASLALMQFVNVLKQGYAPRVLEYIEKIQAYNSNHLDKRHNYRNSIIIRMITTIRDKELNFVTVKERCENYHGKLQNFQIPGDLVEDMEVVPFDKMWDEILRIFEEEEFNLNFTMLEHQRRLRGIEVSTERIVKAKV